MLERLLTVVIRIIYYIVYSFCYQNSVIRVLITEWFESSIEEDLRNSITSSTSYIPGEGEKVNDQKWRCFLLQNFGETRDWLEKNVCMLVTLSLSFFHHFFCRMWFWWHTFALKSLFPFPDSKMPKSRIF